MVEPIDEMISELLDCGELSTWEYDFINDMTEKDSFTESQEFKIVEIHKQYIH